MIDLFTMFATRFCHLQEREGALWADANHRFILAPQPGAVLLTQEARIGAAWVRLGSVTLTVPQRDFWENAARTLLLFGAPARVDVALAVTTFVAQTPAAQDWMREPARELARALPRSTKTGRAVARGEETVLHSRHRAVRRAGDADV